MDYHKYGYHHKPENVYMEDECQCGEMPYMKEKMEEECYSNMCADMSKMKCKMEKECVKTYKTYYKVYKICQYRMYKICPCCGHEYDYHKHHGMCPRCGISM